MLCIRSVHAAVAVYVLCSSCMLVVNKSAMECLPFVYTVTVLQTAASAWFLCCARFIGIIEFRFPSLSIMLQWTGVLAAWIIPILLNMKAIHLVSVETMMMFRSLTIVAVALGDFLFLRTSISIRQRISCIVISAGGLIFASNDMNFHGEGYIWGSLYALSMVVNSLYIKHQFNLHSHMSSWEKSFLNNLLATPTVLGIVTFFEDPLMHIISLSIGSWCILFLSCIMGLGISMSGTKCRDVLSATSFDVLGNCTKYLTLGISSLVLNSKNSMISILGICVALSGTVLYSPAGQLLWDVIFRNKRKTTKSQ